MPLWGQDCPLLALAASACLSHVGNGPVTSLLALLCPLFCEHSWQFLRLELFTVQFSLSLSLFFPLSLWLSHSLGCYLMLVPSDFPLIIQAWSLL